LRAVVFSPEDLALVKGDPAARRSFLDDLLVQMHPRIHAVIDDFEKALRQRNALLKSIRERRAPRENTDTSLAVWDEHVASAGGSLVAARMALVNQLRDPFSRAYAEITEAPGEAGDLADLEYRAGWIDLAMPTEDRLTPSDLARCLQVALVRSRDQDLARGVTTIGPQRDDVDIRLDSVPARGYASHGESWSLALALRLSAFRLLRDAGPTPVLLLDDVFAELDTRRRTSLAEAITDADQVIVTAAVEEDVPVQGPLRILDVASGTIRVRTTE
jgi:DNA replication and repair protein RecF